MVPQWLIEKKRDGGVLSAAEIEEFIRLYAGGTIPDYQMSAMAMAIFFRGMDEAETAALTDAMMRSGALLDWDDCPMPTADKHSTGGIGDKISLMLAPLVATQGVAVPMISGRGLGITGGTLDKLDSIPGYNSRLEIPDFKRIVSEVGCSIIGQTALFVIILTPLVMGIFAVLARKGKAVSTPRKIAYGMGLAGCAYLFLMIFSIVKHYPSGDEFRAMDAATMAARGLAKAAPWVMIVTYFFLTVAELFISPLGLSFVSKVAPRHMVGLCQGLWLGATAIGILFIFVGPIMLNAWDIWKCWGVFLLICLVSMTVMFGMVKWLERVTE